MHVLHPLKRLAVRTLAAFTGPRMVYGWRNADGVFCPNSRVSTHTALEVRSGLVLGDHVFIGHFNRIDGAGGLVIEEGCQITNYVSVLSHSSHRAVRVMGRRYLGGDTPAGYVRRATRIGAYSFVGPHSVIAPGANLGKGVLVQAFSFVSGTVPDFAIVGSRVMGERAVVLGDTRSIDRAMLQADPALHEAYAQWAGQGTLQALLGASAPPGGEGA